MPKLTSELKDMLLAQYISPRDRLYFKLILQFQKILHVELQDIGVATLL